MTKSTHLFNLAMGVTGIVLYQLYGLQMSMLVSLCMMTAWVLGHKVVGKKVDRFLYFQLGLFILLGVPGLVLNKGIFYKLSDSVSGFLCAFGILAAKKFMNEPVMKSFLPTAWVNSTAPNAWLPKIQESTWHKIDSILAAQLIVSAAINLSIALTFPTYVWYYSSYAIGPVTSFVAYYMIYRMVKPDLNAKNPLDNDSLKLTCDSPSNELVYKKLRNADAGLNPTLDVHQTPKAAPAATLKEPKESRFACGLM